MNIRTLSPIRAEGRRRLDRLGIGLAVIATEKM